MQSIVPFLYLIYFLVSRFQQLQLELATLDLDDKAKAEKLFSLSQELETSKRVENDLKAEIVKAEESIQELMQKMEAQNKDHQVNMSY